MNNNILIERYFEENSLIESNINSFNNFVDKGMSEVISEIGDISPPIVPPDVEDFKIRLDKIWVDKPNLIEADGSKRNIFPVEARLRSLTYSAPIHLEVRSEEHTSELKSHVNL